MRISLFGIVAAFVLLMTLTSPADADAIYSYTGNPFTSIAFSEEGIPDFKNPLSTGDFVSLDFTVASPLPDNFSGDPLQPYPPGYLSPPSDEGSISNGIFTLEADLITNFQIQTSDTGAIIAWNISFSLFGVPVNDNISTGNSSDSTFANVATSVGYDFSGSNSDDPGTWSVAVTPLPSGLPLFACGLGALGLFGWRQRKIPHTAL
jgi:hypothetical protein